MFGSGIQPDTRRLRVRPRQGAIHRRRGFVTGGGEQMGVDIGRDNDAGMTEELAHDLQRDTLGQEQRGSTVSQFVWMPMSQPRAGLDLGALPVEVLGTGVARDLREVVRHVGRFERGAIDGPEDQVDTEWLRRPSALELLML